MSKESWDGGERRAMNDRHYELLQEMNNKLTELGTHMYTIIGNGQPGRLGVVEADMKDHDRMLNRIKGAIAVICALLGSTILAEAYAHFLRKP